MDTLSINKIIIDKRIQTFLAIFLVMHQTYIHLDSDFI